MEEDGATVIVQPHPSSHMAVNHKRSKKQTRPVMGILVWSHTKAAPWNQDVSLVGFLGRCLCSYLIFWQVMEQRTSPCQKYGTSWTNFSYLTPLCALACILRLGAIMVAYKRGFQIFANIYFGSTDFLRPIGWVAILSPAAQHKQCQWGGTKQTSHPLQNFLDNSILVWVLYL